MKKFISFILAVLIFLSGCGKAEEPVLTVAQETIPEQPETVVQKVIVAETEAVTEPLETATPEEVLPGEPGARWYGPYYDDPHHKDGKIRFNCLLRNEGCEELTIFSAQGTYYLDGAVVFEENYDQSKLRQFLQHNELGNLNLTCGDSSLVKIWNTLDDGSYDRAIFAITLVNESGLESIQTFHFAMNEEDITPYSFENYSNWDPVIHKTNGDWNFCYIPQNDTDNTIHYKGMHTVRYLNGLPVSSGFADISFVQTIYRQSFEMLKPGAIGSYQDGTTLQAIQNWPHNEVEATMVYQSDQGELYLQTFRFALDDNYALKNEDPENGIHVLDTMEELTQEIGQPQYTKNEIQQIANAGLTLDETAEKLTTLTDVMQYLLVKNVIYDGESINTWVNEMEWAFNDSAQTAFKKNTGNCGSGSSLINYLLRNDYEEQGYIQEWANQSGHIYNYFLIDGIYYIFDWATRTDTWFQIYAVENLQSYSDFYIGQNHLLNHEKGTSYELIQYSYPYEGDCRPVGFNPNVTTRLAFPLGNVIPAEIRDIVTILFVEDMQFAPVFHDLPPEDLWPTEAH